MAIMCECNHKKSNHENRRDDGRFSGKCKGIKINGVKHPCGCSFFTENDKGVS